MLQKVQETHWLSLVSEVKYQKNRMSAKILFILKRREDYDPAKHTAKGLSTGLLNSASFVVDCLAEEGKDVALEVAIDNNCIDRLVTKHKPSHVIIEALWVVPSKFDVLRKLHPHVEWIIRLHSETPFIAGEGIAMNWIADYITHPNVYIGINAPRVMEEMKSYLRAKFGSSKDIGKLVVYLPNSYPREYKKAKGIDYSKEAIDISCFGAVRPLKNHLVQALAALTFAQKIGKNLNFHINSERLEMNGSAVLNNIKGMFEQLADTNYRLICHGWKSRDEFLQLCGQMDIGMQVSFSETFNIVGADHISQGVPIVGSAEIPWYIKPILNEPCRPAYSAEIVRDLEFAYKKPELFVKQNQHSLLNYTQATKQTWLKTFYEF
jgi:hypothetical protein